ncbi:SKP1-like protein 20 [Apium graveolens]|uniref:SKP1-like protein 20 n=1 Tax=Apium graveolens TaxID=4045 RepID=UPI003D7AC9B4
MSSSSEGMIALKSCEGDVVYIRETGAIQSLFIRREMKFIKADPAYPPIDLDMINTATLNKVIDYCNHHAEFANDKAALDSFDAQFFEFDGNTSLFQLIYAAHYLKIYSLMDLTCRTLSQNIKGKSIAKLRRLSENSSDDGECLI